MSQKEQKAIFKPEKSEEAIEKINNELPFEMDGTDQLSMLVMTCLTLTMRMDPIVLWLVFFFLVSLAINKGSGGSILSQSLMSAVICLVSIIIKYYQITSGALPIPKKWEF